MSALASILLFALAISTTENNEFFVTPEWMPRAVSSQDTPGSDDWEPSGNTLVSSNSASMLQAVMDGYCQRAYWFNKAVSNKWNVAQYGGTMPLTFDFPARLNGGDRTVPQDRAVVGLENMYEIAENCHFGDFRIYRPSWPCDAFWVSSSALRCLREGDGGGTSRLDDGLPRGFPWTDGGLNYEDVVGRYAVPLAALAPDAFHTERTPAPLLNLWKDICHDDYQFTNMTASADDIITNNYDQAVALTFSESTNSAHWKPSGIFAVTNILDKPRAWMGSAARALAPIDRVYIANRLTGSTREKTSSYTTLRAAMISTQVPVVWKNASTFEVQTPDIELSDWVVSDTECATNIEDKAAYYSNLAELRVSKMVGSFSRDIRSVIISDSEKVYRRAAEDILALSGGDGDHTFTISTEGGGGAYLVVLRTYNQEGIKDYEGQIGGISWDFPSQVDIVISAYTEKTYDVVERYQGGREMYDCTRNFADGGEYAFLQACASDIDVYGGAKVYQYAIEKGNHPGYSLAELIEYCAGDVYSKVNDLVYQKTHGLHWLPLQYAPIAESEVRTKGKLGEGTLLANSLMGEISGSYTRSGMGTLHINEDVTVRYPDGSVNMKWSELEYIGQMRWGVIVPYTPDELPTLYGKDEHSAVGDAYLIQSKTFDFGALKIGE